MPAHADRIDRILAQWRRERPDLDVMALGTFGRLFLAEALADAALAKERARFGLQEGWFDLLAALRRAGRPFELTPTQLMVAMMLSSGGVTKRLDRLVEAGLIRRRPDPADRRGTLVGLTAKGKAAIDRAVRAHVAKENLLLEMLDAGERRTLDGLLRKLVAGLEESEGTTLS